MQHFFSWKSTTVDITSKMLRASSGPRVSAGQHRTHAKSAAMWKPRAPSGLKFPSITAPCRIEIPHDFAAKEKEIFCKPKGRSRTESVDKATVRKGRCKRFLSNGGLVGHLALGNSIITTPPPHLLKVCKKQSIASTPCRTTVLILSGSITTSTPQLFNSALTVLLRKLTDILNARSASLSPSPSSCEHAVKTKASIIFPEYGTLVHLAHRE
mmetsp:Transcript_8892/g.16669  ORF Transcript_8892/g.16669 Transcript_8892/m.16669 type:complete len:212 (-) Transcript_8892:2101-2736(-)